MEQIGTCLLLKLVECILQSRISIDKKQIIRFNQVNKQIDKVNKSFAHSVPEFLKALLIADKYALAKKIPIEKSHQLILIAFRLIDKQTGVLTECEIWTIDFEQFNQMGNEHSQQEFVVVTTLFQELIIFLNRQPLFTEYQRNVCMKKNYMLDYRLEIGNSTLQIEKTIQQLPHKHTKQRVCPSFVIKVSCCYLPKFDQLLDSLDRYKQAYSVEKPKGADVSTIDTSKNAKKADQDSEKSRKSSVYEYYDKQLDFTFLSSDDESFKHSPKNQVKELDIAFDESEQFQLLVVSKDEQFIDDNIALFTDLSNNEHTYLKN